MSELSVATTVNPRFDHVTPIEATQSAVTITHRCHVFAELVSVARSGLVDMVLIADDFELVGLETLQQLLDAQGQGPKVAAISDVADDRNRLAALGVPVASPTLSGVELVEWLRQAHQSISASAESPNEFSLHELQILEQLDPDTSSTRRSGRRAAPYDPSTDLPEVSDVSAEVGQHDVLADPTDGTAQSHDLVPQVHRSLEEAERDGEINEATNGTSGSTRRGQVTAVWGPIGAPGVTTVAVNVAVESALEGHRTLLIDADTYGAAVSVHLGLLDDTAAVAQACRAIEHRGAGAVNLGDYVQHVNVAGHSLDVITGLTRSERWPQLRAAAWEQLLDIARDGWDHIVIDCGFGLEEDAELSFDIPAPQRNATTVSSVSQADTVLAVGTGDPVGFVRFMKGLDQLTETTNQPVVPVVNKVTAMTSGIAPKRQLTTVWERFGPKTELEHFIPWAPEITAAALLEGKTLAERAPKAEVRLTLRKVLQSCVTPVVSHVSRSGAATEVTTRWSFRHVVSQVKERVGRRSETDSSST